MVSNFFTLSNKQGKTNVELEFNLSDALKYTLGFRKDKEITISSLVDYASESFNSTGHFLEVKYLPDINNGVNNMFIYCVQSEDVPVGNTISELLCIVPIDKEQGEWENCILCTTINK